MTRRMHPVTFLVRPGDAALGEEPPEGPDLDVNGILTVHRYPDGFIGFQRKTPTGFENLFAIQTKELENMLPGISHWLLQDSYFTVNDFYAPARWTNRTTGLPDVRRKEKYLSRLMACYLDVDCGRPESEDALQQLPALTAIFGILVNQDYGRIPPASILARSGRGIYAFWLLHNPADRTGFQSAWPEKVQLYKSVNKALGERLRLGLPIDVRAFDAARVLRVPGSVHSATGRRVTYWPQLDQHGKPFFYTLAELADFLKLDTPDVDLPDTARQLVNQLYLPAPYRRTKHPGTSPNRVAGRLGLYALRVQDLLLVLQHRRGILKLGMRWPDGHVSPGRRFTISLLADWLHWCNTPRDEALETLHQLAETAKPAFPSDSNDATVGALLTDAYVTTKKRRWRNSTLCRLYGITPDMARELDLQSILPAEVKAERDANRTSPWQRRQDAAEYLRQYIEAHRHWPSMRKAAEILRDAGFPTSHVTAGKLLKTLQLSESPHAGEVHVEHRTSPVSTR